MSCSDCCSQGMHCQIWMSAASWYQTLLVDNQPDIMHTARECSRGMPSHHEDTVFLVCASLMICSSGLQDVCLYLADTQAGMNLQHPWMLTARWSGTRRQGTPGRRLLIDVLQVIPDDVGLL